MCHFAHTFLRPIEVALWVSQLSSADLNISWFLNKQAPSLKWWRVVTLFCCRDSHKCMFIPFFSGFCLFPIRNLNSLYSIVLWDIGKLGRHSFGNLVKFKSNLVLEWGKPLSSFGHDIIFWRYATLRKKDQIHSFPPQKGKSMSANSVSCFPVGQQLLSHFLLPTTWTWYIGAQSCLPLVKPHIRTWELPWSISTLFISHVFNVTVSQYCMC